MKTWKNQIKNWLNEIPLKLPKTSMKDNSKGFYYQTSCCTSDYDTKYESVFKKTDGFSEKQNFKKFESYLLKSKNLYATSFISPSKTILVIPIPRKGKNFAHLRLFTENASKRHQCKFWKYVAKLIIELLKENKSLYLSTHGKDVPYFHVRIECVPKNQYYKKFLLDDRCNKKKEDCSWTR